MFSCVKVDWQREIFLFARKVQVSGGGTCEPRRIDAECYGAVCIGVSSCLDHIKVVVRHGLRHTELYHETVVLNHHISLMLKVVGE